MRTAATKTRKKLHQIYISIIFRKKKREICSNKNPRDRNEENIEKKEKRGKKALKNMCNK
jgi:hypothetical protein